MASCCSLAVHRRRHFWGISWCIFYETLSTTWYQEVRRNIPKQSYLHNYHVRTLNVTELEKMAEKKPKKHEPSRFEFHSLDVLISPFAWTHSLVLLRLHLAPTTRNRTSLSRPQQMHFIFWRYRVRIPAQRLFYAKYSKVHTWQDMECTYKVTLWRVRVMFVPPWVLQQPDTIFLENSAFMAI